MKKFKKSLCLVALFLSFNSYAGCDGNFYATISVAEEAGFNPNRHLMWGNAAANIGYVNQCKDHMQYYTGGGSAQFFIRSYGGSSETVMPGIYTAPNGTISATQHGSYNSGSGNDQWVAIDVVAELVKTQFPNYIDAAGRFVITVVVPVRKPNSNNAYTYYHLNLVVYSDYRVKQIQLPYVCESASVNFADCVTHPIAYTNEVYSASNNFTLVNGTTYSANNIGTSLTENGSFTYQSEYQIGNEAPDFLTLAMYNNIWNYNGGSWTVCPILEMKHVIINKTFPFTIYNQPTATLITAYPNPYYDNDPSIVLNSYWAFEGAPSIQYSSAGVSYNSGNNTYSFNPSNVGSGVHNVNVYLNNQNVCYTSYNSPITVTKYPGTPNKPSINFGASFDYTTDSAIVGNGCLAPVIYDINGGSVIDGSYYIRHKWLCPNVIEDSIELFIQSPASNLTYEWKVSIDGLEQFYGSGVSKKIKRAHNELPNSGNSYKEFVYFRSKNIVNNYSAWEYVELEYPVIPYSQISPNDSSSLYYLDTVCHDGNFAYSLTNQYLTQESFLGWTVGNSVNEFRRDYTYESGQNSQSLINSGNFNYSWNNLKVDTFNVSEKGYLKRNSFDCWINADWCNCDVRKLDVLAVKTPHVTSVVATVDSVYLQDIQTISTTSDWSGSQVIYVDSSYNNYFIGDSQTFYSSGNLGYHNVYVETADVYGCSSDSMFYDVYYVKGVDFPVPVVDTIVGNPNPSGPNSICLNSTEGGGFIITPNFDGLNDQLSLCSGIRAKSFIVFDRWGNVVKEFENENVFNLEGLKTATYYYKLSIDGTNSVTGFIELKN